MRNTVALFGEAEKGHLASLIFIESLEELNHRLGHPPDTSWGIFFAIQFLLCQHLLVYVRVGEEGFSSEDYFKGITKLLSQKKALNLRGICLPGVSDACIIDATLPLCRAHQCVLLTAEKDLYDYLTSR